MKVLYKFTHGLGDAVQFTCVLQHLRKYHPEWIVDVAALMGKQSAFHGLCNRVFILDREQIDESLYDSVLTPGWYENYSGVGGSPQTKVCNFLREECGMEPDPSLLRYSIHVGDDARSRAAEYLSAIAGPPNDLGEFPVVALHYEGNTSGDKKNLTHAAAARLCAAVLDQGYVPLLLDWDRRSPLPDQHRIFCPNVHTGDLWGATGTGDAEMLAALIGQCALMIGIDSGPLHVAGATDTPSLGVWTGHSPLQFFDLCPNVVHLVPANWTERTPCNRDEFQEFFRAHYNYGEYPVGDPTNSILEFCRALPRREKTHIVDHRALIRGSADFWIRVENAEQDQVIVNDIYHRDSYHLRDLARTPRLIVDIGAHIGCFARLAHSLFPSAEIICVECCEQNIPALKANVESFARVVHAACTYEPGDLTLLNAYSPNCRSTGGSTISGGPRDDAQYHCERLTCPQITLEELVNGRTIDLLKLDCEGSEFSILAGARRDRIATVVGEYHGRPRWESLLDELFAAWEYSELSSAGDLGSFRLRSPEQVP